MALPEPRDHRIPLDKAAELTRRYRDSIVPGTPIAGMYHRAVIDELLAQKECVGVRFYFGREPDSSLTFVVVGVDKDGNDLVNGVIAEDHFPCPPVCGAANPLNS